MTRPQFCLQLRKTASAKNACNNTCNKWKYTCLPSFIRAEPAGCLSVWLWMGCVFPILSSCLAVWEHFLPNRDPIWTTGGESPLGYIATVETQHGEWASTAQRQYSPFFGEWYKYAETRLFRLLPAHTVHAHFLISRFEKQVCENGNILTAFTCDLPAALLINDIQSTLPFLKKTWHNSDRETESFC